ncbi:MAG: GNAT family N-acetyltransferase [Proteobacteria bacterium]|nr:GNAT family N-acetyltransferase [Pseudomonadota bacterium]
MLAPTIGQLMPDTSARIARTSIARSSFRALGPPERSIIILRVETSPDKSLPPTPGSLSGSAGKAAVGDIREYRPDDESACLDIFDSNRPKYFTAPERDLFAAYLRRMAQPFFVAEVAGQVRGCGGFRVDDFGVGFLEWGMVQAHWQGQRVGSNLLRCRLDRIRQLTHAWCVLIDTSQHTAPFFARSVSRHSGRLPTDISQAWTRCSCGWFGCHGTPNQAHLSSRSAS